LGKDDGQGSAMLERLRIKNEKFEDTLPVGTTYCTSKTQIKI
jgi:hypothetical protein